MSWRFAADAVLVVHLAFVAFVVVGGFLALRWRRIVRLHLPAVVYGVAIELIGFTCPLTPLEKALRRRAGQVGYDGGFVEHHVVPVLYPGEFTTTVKVTLAALLVGVNAVAYALVLRRHRRDGRDRLWGWSAPMHGSRSRRRHPARRSSAVTAPS